MDTPIEVTEFPIVTLVRVRQSLNSLAAIYPTVLTV